MIIKVALISLNLENFVSLSIQILKQYALLSKIILKNYCIETFDFNINESNEIITKTIETFDVLGFSTALWNIEKIAIIAKQVKPKHIVLGGPEVSNNIASHDSIKDSNYTIIKGEGENSFRQFLKDYLKNEHKKLYIDIKNNQLHNNLKIYNPHSELSNQKNNKVSILFETIRGCPFRCAYCTWGKRTIRKYSINFIKRELANIFAFKNIDILYIVDSDICIDKKRALTIIKIINELSIKTNIKHIYFDLNPLTITEEVSREISINPLIACSFGLQSTNQKVLNKITRNTNFTKFGRQINIFKKFGNILSFDIILGLPFETKESYLESLNFAINSNADLLNIYLLQVLPNSQLRVDAHKLGITFQSTPPYYIMSSRTISNIGELEAISFWVHVLILFDRLKLALNYVNKNQPIKTYIKFINYLRQDTFFKKINTSLDYRNKYDISKLYNKKMENLLITKKNSFLKLLEG